MGERRRRVRRRRREEKGEEEEEEEGSHVRENNIEDIKKIMGLLQQPCTQAPPLSEGMEVCRVFGHFHHNACAYHAHHTYHAYHTYHT